MANPITVNATTAEDQLIKIAWQLARYYKQQEDELTTGGSQRWGNRVQIELDYTNGQVALRFRLDVAITQGDVTSFRGIEPRASIETAPW